jgi:hypothetical protein
MNYVILTLDLGRPMYFMDHPYQHGFSISTNRERALIINGKKEALMACNNFAKASGLSATLQKINL